MPLFPNNPFRRPRGSSPHRQAGAPLAAPGDPGCAGIGNRPVDQERAGNGMRPAGADAAPAAKAAPQASPTPGAVRNDATGADPEPIAAPNLVSVPRPRPRVDFAPAAGSLPVTPPPAPGAAASSLLKRYRPLETRAAGGFGSVEICLDRRLQRRVAIKRMPLASPRNRTSAETTTAALNEARTASMLQHPNIVQVIDFTYDAAYAYLVMEYVDGMSLEEFLGQVDGHSLTYDEAACVADALVQALSYAHGNGVLHLDIKPANVLIDRSGHVKLADFGMATLTSAAGFGGARGGTIGYMPPEQLNGDEVDERTDVFALAAVLYESLCATAPFRAGTPADSLKNIETGVLYPSDLLPDIPELAEETLLCALSPQPSERMTGIDEFGDRFLAGLGSAREGRRSLERIIDRLTADDGDPEGAPGTAPSRAERVWELDPAEGYLGSRCPRARQVAVGAVGAAATAVASWALLGGMGAVDPAVRGAVAAAIGLAAGLAPQIGSALIVTGFLMLVANATPVLGMLPVVVGALACTAAWWLVWGRLHPAASAAFAALCALACTGGNAFVPTVTAFAGFFLPASCAAPTMGLAVLFGRLLSAALAHGGALPVDAAAASLADPLPWLTAMTAGAGAAAISLLLNAVWKRYRDSRGTAPVWAACAVPLLVSILPPCLAHPMEIASSPPAGLAAAVGAGALSSIIVWICAYLLGYRRNLPEGDRS